MIWEYPGANWSFTGIAKKLLLSFFCKTFNRYSRKRAKLVFCFLPCNSSSDLIAGVSILGVMTTDGGAFTMDEPGAAVIGDNDPFPPKDTGI